MRKRGIPEAMVRAVMSLYEGAKTRVRVGLELSVEFKVKFGVHQGPRFRAMVRAMCGAKLMEKKRTEDLMEMLGLKETAVQMAKANGVRWYGHVLRRDDGLVLRKVLEFEVRGKRKPGRPMKSWKMQVEKESKSVGLEKKDSMNRARWRVGVREIAVGVNPATPVYGYKPGSKLD